MIRSGLKRSMFLFGDFGQKSFPQCSSTDWTERYLIS
jgi:hypothetical protein